MACSRIDCRRYSDEIVIHEPTGDGNAFGAPDVDVARSDANKLSWLLAQWILELEFERVEAACGKFAYDKKSQGATRIVPEATSGGAPCIRGKVTSVISRRRA